MSCKRASHLADRNESDRSLSQSESEHTQLIRKLTDENARMRETLEYAKTSIKERDGWWTIAEGAVFAIRDWKAKSVSEPDCDHASGSTHLVKCDKCGWVSEPHPEFPCSGAPTRSEEQEKTAYRIQLYWTLHGLHSAAGQIMRVYGSEAEKFRDTIQHMATETERILAAQSKSVFQTNIPTSAGSGGLEAEGCAADEASRSSSSGPSASLTRSADERAHALVDEVIRSEFGATERGSFDGFFKVLEARIAQELSSQSVCDKSRCRTAEEHLTIALAKWEAMEKEVAAFKAQPAYEDMAEEVVKQMDDMNSEFYGAVTENPDGTQNYAPFREKEYDAFRVGLIRSLLERVSLRARQDRKE